MNNPKTTRHYGGQLLVAAGLMLASVVAARADYQSTVLNDNPIAFYALNPASDPSSTSPDLTGNGNNGIALGISPATGPSPYITNAANFNGGAAIDLSQGSNPNLLNFQGPITLEAWAQPSSSSLFADIVARGYDSQTGSEIVIRVNGPYGANYYGSSGSVGVTGGTQATNWTYIVLSSDGTNCTLYENGIQVAQSPDTSGSTTNFPAGDDWMIGNGSSAGNGRLFDGNISEVAIYDHGLTSAQILNHYYMGILNTPANSSVPIIFAQPQSQSGYVGENNVTFSVGAVSALATTNQWYFNGDPIVGQTGTSLVLTNLQLTNAGNYSVIVGNANGTTNSAVAALTVSVPQNLEWSQASQNNGTWDNGVSANWSVLPGGTAATFTAGDTVLFDDTPNVPTTVTVSGTVVPGSITVNSTNNSFTITSGTLSGPGSFTKEGPSQLTINSGNGLTGPVTLAGGYVYAGNNCFDSVASIVITNSTLDFGGGQIVNNQPVTVSGFGINGAGAMENSYNNYPSELLAITLAGDTKFAGTARWDFKAGSSITGPYTLYVDESSNSVNNYYAQWNSVGIGADVVGIDFTNALSDTGVVTSLGLTGMDNEFANPATVLTVETNCQLVFYSGGINGSLHLASGATLFHYTAPAGFYGSTITLDQGATIQSYYNGGETTPVYSAVILNGVAHFVLGDHYMDYTNVISGPGGFVLDYYNNDMVFSASNTYSGPTIIGSGGNSPQVALTGNGSISHSALIFFGGADPTVSHIDASGRADSTLTLANGQTLAGVGGVTGNLTVTSDAILSPGGTNTTIGITTGSNPVGTLAASGNVTLGGTTEIKLNGSTNDVVTAGGTLTYGGTLNLANISGTPLAAGNTFKVFNAATYSGSFGQVTPAPGAGLSWDTSQLSQGIISVIGSGGTKPVINPPQISGGNLIFSGTGGTANATYYVLETTNLLSANWVPVSTNSFDASGNFNVTNSINSSNPQLFYRIELAPASN